MKYIKITALLLVLTTIISSSGVLANVVTILNITIPAHSEITATGNHNKDNYGRQQATKTDCTDNLSGNQMAIEARVHSVNYGTNGSWYTLPKGTNVNITGTDGVLASPGTFNLQLKAANSFITQGTFYGAWNIN